MTSHLYVRLSDIANNYRHRTIVEKLQWHYRLERGATLKAVLNVQFSKQQ